MYSNNLGSLLRENCFINSSVVFHMFIFFSASEATGHSRPSRHLRLHHPALGQHQHRQLSHRLLQNQVQDHLRRVDREIGMVASYKFEGTAPNNTRVTTTVK